MNAGATDPSDIRAHNSPLVVRNPRDGAGLVVASRVDSPRYGCTLHVSVDAGATWTETPVPPPPGAGPCYALDAAFDAGGVLHVAFVTLEGPGNVPAAGWLARSEDGGRTLSDPEPVLGPLAFQVRLSADPVRPGRLFLTWLQASEVSLYSFPETGNPILLKTSIDGGRTWTPPVRVSDPSVARAVAPSAAVGDGGELLVLYLDLGDDALDYAGGHQGRGGPPYPARWRLLLARSPDGGERWEHSVVEDDLTPAERFVVFSPPFPSIALAERGRVHAAFHDGRRGDADVWAWTSTDGGATWGEAIRVNDTREGDGRAQYLPKIAVAPDGRVDVVYYDRRRDPGNILNEVSLQSSFDGGRSFAPRAVLSDRAFDSRIGFGSERGLPDLGNRLGLVSVAGRAMAVWTDTRAGTDASRKQDLVRQVVAFSESAALPEGAARTLQIGGSAAALAGLLLVARWAAGRSSGRSAPTA